MSPFESYWTVSIGHGPAPWYASEPGERITRGVFPTRDEACQWASRVLGPGDWQAIQVPKHDTEDWS